ncbi:hypothetical protein MMC17_005885 [Xylographa soralifera]|nr:hypothetical protein [Xylographa soralifera]
MFNSQLVYRLVVDLLIVVTVSANFVTAKRSWNSFKFLHLQSPVQFQFFLLGVCLLYTCLRCAVILVLHHPILTGIYTYIFSAGSLYEAPSLFRYPSFVIFCCVVPLSYGMRWLRSGLVIQGRIRPTIFRPSKFIRPFEYWIMTRRDRFREAKDLEQQDLEKLLPAQESESRCDSCHFLLDNSYIRRTIACFDLACVIVLMALLDVYMANRNGWVIENMSFPMALFNDILSWEYFNILFWFTWVGTIVTCVEARFEWNVADRCRQKKRELNPVQTKGSLVEK